MPRNVRNFWLELDVDGKKERIATGPRNSGGGFQLTIKLREDGAVSDREMLVTGRANSDGTLTIEVQESSDGSKVTVATMMTRSTEPKKRRKSFTEYATSARVLDVIRYAAPVSLTIVPEEK